MVRSIYPLFAFALAASAPALAAEAIPTPHFRSVRLIGGGDVEIVPGPVQRVTLINGSTELTHFQVRRYDQLEISTSCYARCPQHYNLRIRIESPTVPDVSVHAGGTIVASRGFAPQQEVAAAISAGGTIDLRAVAGDTVSAAVNAGGDIFVHPRVALNAAVTAGGDIHYIGDPQVSSAITAGGDVRRDY
ncbi:MAG: GIN domain-containing protein [Bacillota bacterium]